MEPLSERQKHILESLTSYIKEKGYAPSQRELARRTGLKSPNTVDYHLKRLEARGLVKCAKKRFRAVELLQGLPRGGSLSVPVLGTVPAGPPNLAQAIGEETLEVDARMAKGTLFGLKVKGDSMKDAGILEGDIVLVRAQPTALDGEIVVARMEDEATVKYFRKFRDGFYLVPANERYKPIPLRDAAIAGKVTGVIRRY